MYIGIISDTHGVFSDGFRKFLEPVDEIWHAGDFGGGIEFAAGIAAFKPLVGVWGNCDGQDIRAEYPEFKFLELQGLRILLKHIGGSPGHYDKDSLAENRGKPVESTPYAHKKRLPAVIEHKHIVSVSGYVMSGRSKCSHPEQHQSHHKERHRGMTA